MIPLIGLAGYKQAGKTSVANVLVGHYGYRCLPFARPLKDMLRALGLSERQLSGDMKEVRDWYVLNGLTPREAMQSLGTEWARKCIDSEVWLRAWEQRAEGIRHPIVVDDVRFANEADLIHRHGGLVIRVDRPGFEPKKPTLWQRLLRRKTHASEVIDFPCNAVIRNDGSLHDLQCSTDTLMRWRLKQRTA